MRGIFVGVSLGIPEIEVFRADGGPSPLSFMVCELLALLVATEGEPAIVGSCVRLRRELSDCFCIELTVAEVSLDDVDDTEARLEGLLLTEDLSFATRLAVTGSIAEICMGGRLTGDLGFLGSVDDKVYHKNWLQSLKGFNTRAYLASLAVDDDRYSTFAAILILLLLFLFLLPLPFFLGFSALLGSLLGIRMQ